MPSLPFVQAGRPSGYISAIMRFTHTSSGNASYFPNPYRSVHSATFLPTPFIFCSSCLPNSMGEAAILSKSISPDETLFAASIMYFALKPARSEAKSSGALPDSTSGEGKVNIPLSSSLPKHSQSLFIIPFIRGILLFCEIINEQSASHGS